MAVDVIYRLRPPATRAPRQTRSSLCEPARHVATASRKAVHDQRRRRGPARSFGVERENGLFAMRRLWTGFLPQMFMIRKNWLDRGVLGDTSPWNRGPRPKWFAEDADFRLFAPPKLGVAALLEPRGIPGVVRPMVLRTRAG